MEDLDKDRDELSYKLLPPPTYLPEYDPKLLSDISYFAKTNYADGMYRTEEIVGLKREDRNRHVYILGKSGAGKTSLLEQLIRFDVLCGYGVAVVDPHGDMAKSLLDFIPEERVKDVVYIDPSDSDYPLAFNPFASVPVAYRQIVAQGLIEIFRKQFASTWTPRIEHLFRFATLAMLEYEQGTLYGFVQLLTDAHYRQDVLQHIQDDVVKRFFSVEFASFSQKYDQEAITPLTNRLGQFFSDPMLRKIFSSPENRIHFDEIVNGKKILILNASKGTLGEENSALLCSFFLTKIEQVAMARTVLDKKDRQPFYLYVDEFQNVATRSFISLFSESRKYGVNITVANQYLSQIPIEITEAVFGNVGTLIMFRLSGSDADRVGQEFRPLLSPHDLINLGVRDCYIKLSFEGKTTPAFSAHTLTLEPSKHASNRSAIIDHVRLTYAQQQTYQPSQTPTTFFSTEISDDLPPV